MSKVAIIGLSPSTHDEAPWADEEWEKWGLPWDAYAPRCSVLFEMHDRSLWEGRRGYLDRLRELPGPIYMQHQHPDIPGSEEYPLAAAQEALGADYFGSSPAYMAALAAVYKVPQVGLWGVELAEDSAYEHQRPNLEYVLGVLRGRGVRVDVCQPSALLRHRPEHKFDGRSVSYPVRYGWV